MHNWHNWMQVFELHLSEVALLAAAAFLPTGTFKEESIDVGTSLGEFWEVGLLEGVEHFSD